MAKVKVRQHQITEKEIDLDYPIYVYFQDENCNDELIKIDENYQLSIKYNHFGFDIICTSIYSIEEHHLKNVTTKEHFEMTMDEAIKWINERK